MQKISAYIVTFNEAEKIKAAVESVLWADEVAVVDSHITDGTAEIAAGLGARVVQAPFNGFGDLLRKARRRSAELDAAGKQAADARNPVVSRCSRTSSAAKNNE